MFSNKIKDFHICSQLTVYQRMYKNGTKMN